jgi:hypothetical protein
MSELDAQFVKRGLWTNLDQGAYMGKTITTDTSTGVLIVALLAILSTLGMYPHQVVHLLKHRASSHNIPAAGHLWNLVVFSVHQSRTNEGLEDGLFRQQQAILRTSPTSTSLLTDSLRGRSVRARHFRSLSLFLLALTFTIITLAVGVFSSYVVSSTDLEVLVDSPFCGTVPAWEDESAAMAHTYVTAVAEASDAYISHCYQNASILSAACKVFTRPATPYSMTRVPCPFASPLCLGNLSAVELDTGLLDVALTFGLNSPRRDRVRYQKKAVCTLLPLGDYMEVIKASEHEDMLGRKAIFAEEKLVAMKYGTHPAASGNITRLYPLINANISKTMTVS